MSYCGSGYAMCISCVVFFFFFSSRRRHTRCLSDWSSDVCSSDLDYQGFYEKELNFRRMMHYPPFSAMANVLVRSEKKEMAMRMSTELGYLLNPPPEKLRVMGPAEAPVPRLKNEYRYQFLIKAASRKSL